MLDKSPRTPLRCTAQVSVRTNVINVQECLFNQLFLISIKYKEIDLKPMNLILIYFLFESRLNGINAYIPTKLPGHFRDIRDYLG